VGESCPSGFAHQAIDAVSGHEVCDVGVHVVPPFAWRLSAWAPRCV